ncbi:MAG TPA: M20 family metallopeptidase [Terriglobia bacterium]|nr:M20 family metallopeptidase [Terriglobia bacterium]
MNPRAFLDYCQSDLDAMLRCLKRAVEIESPTSSKPHVDRMANFFAREFTRARGTARVLKHPTAGCSVIGEFWGASQHERSKSEKPILLLGHIDTVWDVGTLSRMPFRISKGRAYGPGVMDMKSGIVCGLWAIRALRALHVTPSRPVRFFLNSDEEVSTIAFRKQILAEARDACAVLVLEPAAGYALKTARKGVGEFRITVHGRSAHAGVNPSAGVNAIAELARQLLRIEKLARPRQGLTLNVGVVQGGTRSNVIPERAWAAVDVRIPRAVDQKSIERKVYGLKPIHPQVRLEITGGINRPPLEHARAVDLFRKARELGRQMGMKIEEAGTGGGSDGNFTAALGIPTLDGLGGVGDGAHALHEHVIVSELPRRAALLAALIAAL